MLHKVQLQNVLPAGRNRHYVMEVPKPTPFLKTTIANIGSISSETTGRGRRTFRHPNIAVRIDLRKILRFVHYAHPATKRLLTEIVGLQVFLTHVLSPMSRGEWLDAEQYEEIMRQVKAKKHRWAQQILAKTPPDTHE